MTRPAFRAKDGLDALLICMRLTGFHNSPGENKTPLPVGESSLSMWTGMVAEFGSSLCYLSLNPDWTANPVRTTTKQRKPNERDAQETGAEDDPLHRGR